MRPERLTISGFSTFRDEVVIDFAGADLFALVGPTGSGKSSVIDAIAFALYGRIPRLDNKLVAPVINQVSNEAKVLLEFRLGEERWNAVRVARRSPKGATTKEARLERVGDDGRVEVVAGDANAMSVAVADRLGLDFDQFCQCVLLPQGEFARFLHATSGERQRLLVRLLDLGLYAEMGKRARERATRHRADASAATEQLAKLADATPERLAELHATIAGLEALQTRVRGARPELDRLRDAAQAATAEAAARRDACAVLDAVRAPVDVDRLVAAAAQTRQVADTAAAALADADAAEAAADAGLAAHRPEADLQADRRIHDDLAREEARVPNGEAALVEVTAEADVAAAAFAEARAAHAAAAAAHEAARVAHGAAAIVAHLHPGDECPVCGAAVGDLSDRVAPPDLAAADAAERAASTALEAARDAVHRADKKLTATSTKLDGVRDGVNRLRLQVARLAPAVELDLALGARADAESAAAAARAARRDAASVAANAASSAGAAAAAVADAWRDFDACRDRLGAYQPPPADRDDLAASWAGLVAWAAVSAGESRVRADAASRQAEVARADRAAAEARLRDAVTAAGVVALPEASPEDAVSETLGRRRADAADCERRIAEADEVRARVASANAAAAVAEELGRLLKTDNFEQWVLNDAVTVLVRGATDLLSTLSAGQYALTLTANGEFGVIDHRNADEVRLARTLSGGETFLASLALALALADQIAEFAVGGAARLESLFLDEGFGTLDPDTLDVVASAIEELGARGRVVGLVTHVRELADRVPVRFEVRKLATTSTVERVEG